MEIVSKVHAKNLVRWAKHREEVLVLSADLTSSTEIDAFRDAYPERFLSMGIAEQNMLSFAGGLAREGFTPFVHTFAVFIYRRAFDQIAMSVAYPNLKVRMFGFLPGITTPGGASHQAIEDIAVMRSLPNMTVLECGDATEVESILDVAQSVDGPVYVRMLRGEVPRLFDASIPMKLGTARRVCEGEDVLILSSGICTQEVMRIRKALEQRGVYPEHLHISTLKPFDDEMVLHALKKAKKGVITIENHTIVGGLGSCVAEVLAENGLGNKLVRLGIRDCFSHGASKEYLMRECGIDGLTLARKVGELVGENLELDEKELSDVHLQKVHSNAKAEAL